MKSVLFFRRDDARRGGFTLIEVAIALIIFVFGALAIIRIFPPGLGVIQNSGDQLVAVNLNRSTLARFAKQPKLVPDAIHDYFDHDNNPATPLIPNPTWRGNIVGSVAGPIRRNNSLPVGNVADLETAYAQSALGHFKKIVGERHTVPGNGIVLTQFPFVNDSAISIPTIFVEDEVTGVKILADGTLDFSQSKLASTDTSFSTTVAPPTTHRFDSTAPATAGNTIFYVSYRWLENLVAPVVVADQQVSLCNDEPLIYTAAATNPKTVQGQRKTAGASISLVEGEISVRFRQIIANPVAADINGDVGSLKLTPSQKVSLDYQVKDWRWMVYDGVPMDMPEAATATQRAINLPVKLLDEAKAPAYLYSTTTPANVKPKIGEVLYTTPPTGITRVAYWTLDNWAQQLSVAARDYKLFYPAALTVPAEPWRDCVLEGSILYFKPSEAGKSVMVSYAYGTNSQINGRVMTISDEIIPAPTSVAVNALSEGGQVSRLELTDVNGNLLATPVTAIQKIRGVSVQTRTAWIDGNRFNQTSTTGFRGAN